MSYVRDVLFVSSDSDFVTWKLLVDEIYLKFNVIEKTRDVIWLGENKNKVVLMIKYG